MVISPCPYGSLLHFGLPVETFRAITTIIINPDHTARVPWDLPGIKSWASCTDLMWWTITMDSLLKAISLSSSDSVHSGKNTFNGSISSKKKAWLCSPQTASSAVLSLCFSGLPHLKLLSHDGRIMTSLFFSPTVSHSSCWCVRILMLSIAFTLSSFLRFSHTFSASECWQWNSHKIHSREPKHSSRLTFCLLI